MRRRIQQTAGEAVWALAARQHWVVSRRQLVALGFTPKAIERRIANRRLHVLWRGVYAVGHPEPTRLGHLMAAVLAAGPGAVLSHQSAAELWAIRQPRNAVMHVSIRGSSARRLPGLRIHRRPTLADADIAEHLAIPTTAPTLTLLDLATTLRRGELETAINECDRLDLLTPHALRRELETRAGVPGVRPLRAILDRVAFSLTDSQLERRFLPLSRRAGLPEPRTQAWVAGFRVDFFYERIGLVVETDGLRYHRTPLQQARDRRRDQAHAAAGLATLRFTHAQVRYEPAYVRATLSAVHARLMNRPPPRGADSSNGGEG